MAKSLELSKGMGPPGTESEVDPEQKMKGDEDSKDQPMEMDTEEQVCLNNLFESIILNLNSCR